MTITKVRPDAPTVALAPPDRGGYVLLAGTVTGRQPFLPSRRMRKLIAALAPKVAELGRQPGVQADLFRAQLVAPGMGHELLQKRAGIVTPAHFDVVVLVRTDDPEAAKALRDNAAYKTIYWSSRPRRGTRTRSCRATCAASPTSTTTGRRCSCSTTSTPTTTRFSFRCGSTRRAGSSTTRDYRIRLCSNRSRVSRANTASSTTPAGRTIGRFYRTSFCGRRSGGSSWPRSRPTASPLSRSCTGA